MNIQLKFENSLELPNIKDWKVWLMKMTKFNINTRRIHGKFYYNDSKKIQDGNFNKQIYDQVDVDDYDILQIYESQVDEKEIDLTTTNIEDIESFVKLSVRRRR